MNQYPSDSESAPDHANPMWREVLYVLIKHKWKIGVLAFLGVAGAAAVYLLDKPIYESQAKLLVRYVVDRNVVDPVESANNQMNRTADTVLNSEVEMLGSWDLAIQAARKITPARMLAGSKDPITDVAAAQTIMKSLKIGPVKGSNVIVASYRSDDPVLATLVLKTIVDLYLEKHLKIRQSAEGVAYVEAQATFVRNRLTETEKALEPLKTSAGIISLPQSTATLTTQLSKTEDDLRAAEAELAEQSALVDELERTIGTPKDGQSSTEAAGASVPAPPAGGIIAGGILAAKRADRPMAGNADVQKYQTLVTQLDSLNAKYLETLAVYKPGTREVSLIQTQIDALTAQRRELEEKFPDLTARLPLGGIGGANRLSQQPDLPTERARLAGIQDRTKTLTEQLAQLRLRFTGLVSNAPLIEDLERRKQIDEESLKYFSSGLQKARADLNLKPSNLQGIIPVQDPSPAARVTRSRNKLIAGLAGGGLAFGIGLALLLEMILNRTIKRPLELESRLNIPFLIAIPYIGRNGSAKRLRNRRPKDEVVRVTPRGGAAPWDMGHFIRPYAEVIRDRLALFFEVNQVNHKPKLVAVTGCSTGAGASTLAGSLAATLSETSDSKVLLVDMNVGQAEVQPFFKGQRAYSLTDALETPEFMDSAAENLYLATASPSNQPPVPLGLKRFSALMPGIKASDYDYVIFDMPPLGNTSPTVALSGLMDMVFVVIEAEASDRDVIRRRYSELTADRGKISVIFNKTRSHAPKWIEGEL